MKKIHLRKNNWLICISLMLFCQNIYSQKVEDLYVKMPDILNPTLSKQNRLELLEYHKAHQSDSVANRFGNQAHLIIMDTLNQQIVVKNTLSSTFEMKILTLEDSTIVIGIIRTVCAPVCQSSIEFYDTAWNKVPLQFSMPKAIDWINPKNMEIEKNDSRWMKNLLEISFISLTFSIQNQTLIAKNNTLEFLNEAERKLIQPYLVDKPILYELVDRKWVQKP